LTESLVYIQIAKEGTVGASCSSIIGDIQQSMLRIEGVKNVKVDPKGVSVTFDPSETTPEKIVVGFNKENPETLLQLSDAKQRK
jgi:copper chaperone CopZ